jgi:hypothetical protein
MSYSRWGDSAWYTFWSATSPDGPATKNDQVFEICDFPSFSITYQEIVSDVDQVIARVKEFYDSPHEGSIFAGKNKETGKIEFEPCTWEAKNPSELELDELKGYLLEFVRDVDLEYDQMLETQKYLLDKSLDDLKAELGIKVTQDPELGLVILNYDQIESPKTHPIVRECRGLVLELGTWRIAARSFPRFFNWGEVADEMGLFDFGEFHTDSKEDGSLCIIYNYQGQWLANTRGSFGTDIMQFQDFTWREGFLRALGVDSFDQLDRFLDPRLSYVCEFVSPWNKVVRNYSEPTMYLLTVFRGKTELSRDKIRSLENIDRLFRLPQSYSFGSIDEISEYIRRIQAEDPTNEGVVIRDSGNRRWKIKSPAYLSLHRMRGEGDNLYNPKNILPFVLTGEGDELLTYFPEVKDRFLEIKAKVDLEYLKLFDVWQSAKGIENQKEFALSILGKTPFTGVLFELKKKFGLAQEEAHLKKAWLESDQAILKFLF